MDLDLPSTPLWEYLLLEQPWPAIIVLLAVALVIRHVAIRNNKPVLRLAGLGLILAAVAIWLVARSVETDRQRLDQHTRDFLHATEHQPDHERLDELLAADLTLHGPQGEQWTDIDELQPRLESLLEQFPIERHVIRELGSQTTNDRRARSVVDVRTHMLHHDTGLPVQSAWELHWQRAGETSWRLVEIHWLLYQRQPPGRNLLTW